MGLENTLANYIREGNLRAYQEDRYKAIPDGEELVFEAEDFSDVDFSPFSLGFTTFKQCILKRAHSLHGQPITIDNCKAQQLDLTGTHTVINATATDFTGLSYDAQTVLASPENGLAGRSVFVSCTLDPEAMRHFEEQGAIIR